MSGLVFCGLVSFWHHFNIIFGKSSLLMGVWSSDLCVCVCVCVCVCTCMFFPAQVIGRSSLKFFLSVKFSAF